MSFKLHGLLQVEVHLYVNIDITHRSVLSCQCKVSASSCEICVWVWVLACVFVCVCAELKVISIPVRSKTSKTCLSHDIARCGTKIQQTLIERHDQLLFVRNLAVRVAILIYNCRILHCFITTIWILTEHDTAAHRTVT